MHTTPLPEEETKPTRGRGRGRPTTESAATVSEADNVSDETQVRISKNYNTILLVIAIVKGHLVTSSLTRHRALA